MNTKEFNDNLEAKVSFIKKETLKIHKIARDTRIASSISPIEILVTLFYGGIIKFSPDDIFWEGRDRFIISKGHGSISFYPVLADLGYFDKSELTEVCKPGSFLGGIPDCIIPGYETTNGSLGHGLGVGCGIAIALKRKKIKQNIFVLLGDGELFEGSIWEAIMFASHHKLDNLIAIVDNNRTAMLDFTKNIIDIEPLGEKFGVFGWDNYTVDGHNVAELHEVFKKVVSKKGNKPKVVIANTIKGRGVKRLENNPLSHITNLTSEEIDLLI